MKMLISMVMLCVITLTASPAKTIKVADDTLVNAYRVTWYRMPDNPDMHAYFDDIDCVNHFLGMYPQYIRNGKVMVSPDVVFTTCDW